jgi:TolB-like protein
MKTAVKVFLVFTFFLLLAAGGLHAQQMPLDDAIKRAARGIEEVLPQRALVAVLNFASPSETFSDYVIEELTGELVMGRKVTIVDRRSLALISQEMNLQLSGDVSDESAQAIGRLLGAQSIVSGTLTNMGTYHRFRVRVINVETAAIQTQVSLDLQNNAQVAFLLGGSPASAPPAASSGTTPSASTTRVTTTPPIEGTIVPGANLTEKLAWLQRSAESHNIYILELNANENIAPHTFEYRGAINITIALRSDNANRTVRLRSNGTMFTVRSNVTFILENNVTLQGHSGNNGVIVNIEGGTFRMTGGTISGNASSGVHLSSGNFTMNGGIITGNSNLNRGSYVGGGGVCVANSGTFTMNSGTISGNTSSSGGGVYIWGYGGGNFIMNGGTISGNTANGGGGVCLESGGSFTMRGGIITGNTAVEYGGGVYAHSFPNFTKTGGTITGYNSDPSNGNAVRDDAGNVFARRGHAVYVNENRRKETTAGPGVNLSSGATGGWDN